MRKRDIKLGGEYALWPTTPVPTDPYARTFRDAVVKVRCTQSGAMPLILDEDGRSHHPALPRQVLCTWDEWERQLAHRVQASESRGEQRAKMAHLESRALAEARSLWPTAKLRDHAVVIGVEDFLAGLPHE